MITFLDELSFHEHTTVLLSFQSFKFDFYRTIVCSFYSISALYIIDGWKLTATKMTEYRSPL